jgi:hypothetical protein
MANLTPGFYYLYFGSNDDQTVINVPNVGLVGTPSSAAGASPNGKLFEIEYAYGTDFAFFFYFNNHSEVVTNNPSIGLAGSPSSQQGQLFFPIWQEAKSGYKLYFDDLNQVVTNNAHIGLAGSPGHPGTDPVGLVLNFKPQSS